MIDPGKLNVDIAALRTLKLVYERRSFTAVANLLDIQQSAVSYTIEKLRNTFEDPLFYRQGGKVIPTERCETIIGIASDIIEQFTLLTEPDTFDPATAKQTINIACNYYERQILLPLIIKKIRANAPGIRINLINSSHEGDVQLKRSDADILIGPLRPEGQEFYCRNLIDEHYVCVMDPGNIHAVEPLSLSAYTKCTHVTVTYGGSWRSQYLVELASRNLETKEVLWIPSPASLNLVLSGTDLVATVPSRIAAAYRNSLHVTASPIPAPFQIGLVWTTRTHRSPAYVWLRKLIVDSVNENLL